MSKESLPQNLYPLLSSFLSTKLNDNLSLSPSFFSSSFLNQQQKDVIDNSLRALDTNNTYRSTRQTQKEILDYHSNRTLYISNIDALVEESFLITLFESFGPIAAYRLEDDESIGLKKKRCRILYQHPESVESVLADGERITLYRMQCSLSKTPFGEHQSVTSKIIPTQLVGSENSGKITIGSSSFTSEPQMKQSLASLFSSQKPQPMTTSHTQEKPQVAVRSIVAQPAVSKENQTIYIGCINYSVTQNDLMTAFRPFGNIVTCRLVPLQTGSGHRGYAFIEYDNPTSAAIAIETMNDAQFHGRALKVKYQSSSTTSGTNPGPTSSTITQPLLQNPVQVLPSPSPSPSDSADALLRAKQLALQFSKQHSAKPAAPTSTTIGNVINPHGDHDVSSDFNDDSEFISSAQRADLIRKLAMRDSYPG